MLSVCYPYAIRMLSVCAAHQYSSYAETGSFIAPNLIVYNDQYNRRSFILRYFSLLRRQRIIRQYFRRQLYVEALVELLMLVWLWNHSYWEGQTSRLQDDTNNKSSLWKFTVVKFKSKMFLKFEIYIVHINVVIIYYTIEIYSLC